jgi:hypothetical protein
MHPPDYAEESSHSALLINLVTMRGKGKKLFWLHEA